MRLSALLGLDRSDEPRADEPGKLGRMPIRIAGGERLDRCPLVIVAHALDERVQERGLTVPAGAVVERQGVLGGDARQGVSAPALQEGNQLGVAVRDPLQELVPQRRRAIGVGRHAGHLGDVVRWVGGPDVAGSQINNPCRRIEQPRIAVPLVDRGGNPPISHCEPLDCRDRAGAGDQ